TTGGGRARPGVRPGLPGRKHLHAAAGLTLPSPFVDRDVPDPAQDSLHPRKPREEPVSISPPPAASGSTSLRTEGRWAAPPRVRPRERVEVRRRHTPDWSGDLSTFHRGRKNTHEEWVFLPGSVGWNRNLTFFEGSAPPWMHE